MENQITDEQFGEIISKFYAAYIAKYGHKPDYLRVDEYGGVVGVTETYCCGDWETNSEYISFLDLDRTEEQLKEMRKEELRIEEERKKEEADRRMREEKERRHKQFLKLQEEFGK